MIGPFQWVLRNARLHAADRGRRSAAGFVRHIPGEPHRSQVKRWESGDVALTHGLVRRYEVALDLPEGQLLRAIDLIAREDAPLMALPAVPAPESPDVVREAMPLLERALDDEPMTGVQWDRLTTLMTLSQHVLVRSRDWAALVRRLSQETAVSTGLEYAHRWEAAARIISNPHATDVVVELIEGALTDVDEQLYTDYANLLRFCPDPRGHEVLVRVIAAPPNHRSLWASFSTVATLVRHGILSHESTRTILPVALEVVADGSLPQRARLAAASVAQRADGRLLRSDAGGGPRSLELSEDDRRRVTELLSWTGVERERQDLIQAATRDELRRDQRADATDAELATLLHTALREPHLDVRDTALAVLMLSPQGRTLGRVLARDLDGAVTALDSARAGSDVSMLSWLMQPEDLPLLADLAMERRGTDVDTDLAGYAGACVGNADQPGGPAREALDAELAQYARGRLTARARDAAAPTGNAWGVSYALGMRGRFDLLAQLLVLTTRRDGEWRAALRWWTDLPEVVRPARPSGA